MITIEVTAEHIAKGVPRICTLCATAVAIQEQLKPDWVYVCPTVIQIDNMSLPCPIKVENFIREYDSEFPKLAKPYSFELPLNRKDDGSLCYDFKEILK